MSVPGELVVAVVRHDKAGHGRVRAVVSRVETMACLDELLTGIAELAASRDVATPLHTHITDASVRAHGAAFGRTVTQRLADNGMLTPRCTLMHAGSLSDDDITVFAETGVTVNHNSTGHAMLGFSTTAGRSVPRLRLTSGSARCRSEPAVPAVSATAG